MAVDAINSAGGVGPSNCNLKIHKVVISSDSRVAHAHGSSSQVEASQILNSIDLPMTSKSVISHASTNPVATVRLDQSSKGKSNNNRAVGIGTVNVA